MLNRSRMTLSTQRLEKAAEAMAAKRAELQHLPLARIYDELSRAAIAGFLGDDYLVVPKQPTEKMLRCGAEDNPDNSEAIASCTWETMVAAAGLSQ